MTAVIDDAETAEHAAARLSTQAIREGYQPEALHTYRCPTGQPYYWRIRLKHSDGRKWIRPFHRDANGAFVLGEPPFARGEKPLYLLHDLAHHTEATVIVVEGEKAADSLCKIGGVATTSGAADSAAAADWQPLAGRHVLIWPDNDASGVRYGQAVVDKLLVLGCTVAMIDVQALGLPPKGDAWDWCAAHPYATSVDVLNLPLAPELPKLPNVPFGTFGSDRTDNLSESVWPAPQPLPAGLPPVEPFDAALLPDSIRSWVMDIADRVSCPPLRMARHSGCVRGCPHL